MRKNLYFLLVDTLSPTHVLFQKPTAANTRTHQRIACNSSATVISHIVFSQIPPGAMVACDHGPPSY